MNQTKNHCPEVSPYLSSIQLLDLFPDMAAHIVEFLFQDGRSFLQ